MAILGLAIGALASGIAVLASVQLNTNTLLSQARSLRQATAALERPLNQFGPFRTSEPDRFKGDMRGFQFDCKASQPCQVDVLTTPSSSALRLTNQQGAHLIPLRTSGAAHFVYSGTTSPETAKWPPDSNDRQALRSVGIVVAGPKRQERVQVVVSAEQPKICFFDPVMQDCR